MKKEKKPFYKRWWFIVIVALLVIAVIVNPEEEEDSDITEEHVSETDEKDSNNEDKDDSTSEPEHKEEQLDEEATDESDELDETEVVIDTSMYEYSKDVQVTDAIDINNYVSLMIEMNDNLNPGLAFQHATTQTYEFLQQEALQGADKVGINIILEGQKIAMYEVDLNEFKPKDDESMAQLVLDAAIMEMITPEVHEYTQTMGLTYKEE